MNQSVFVIGVAGGSASGKTSIIREVLSRFEQSQVAWLAMDNYYRPIEQQPKDSNGKENFDLPSSIDKEKFIQDFDKLCSGLAVSGVEYTFNVEGAEKNEIVVDPAPIIVVDGLFILYWKEIADRLDLKVFVDTPLSTMLDRRLHRDEQERNYKRDEIMYQWDKHVVPSYNTYLLPHRSECELIIDNSVSYIAGTEELVQIIEMELDERL